MEGKKDVKLFFSLMAWMLIPSVYLAIRMHIVTVNEVDINILGQMEWFDLIDEVIITALITPLYLLLKPKNPSQNGFAFIISFGIYACITTILSLFIGNITSFMQAKYAEQYLTLQAFSLLIEFVGTFCIMLFTMNELYKLVTALTIIKLVLLGISDYIFIGNYGDLGAAYSDIVINLLISFISLTYAISSHYIKFKKAEKNLFNHGLKLAYFLGYKFF